MELSCALSLADELSTEEAELLSKEEVEFSVELSITLSLAEEVESSTELWLEEGEMGVLQAAIVAIVRVAAKANSKVVIFLILFINFFLLIVGGSKSFFIVAKH